jgi:hypothetical protein
LSRRWVQVVVVFGLSLQARGAAAAGAAAAADTDTYQVKYQGNAGCPSEEDVQADVAAHVRDLSRANGVRIRLRVSREPAGFSGELVSTDAAGFEGMRRIEGRTCTEVAHALAFLAALAIELGGRVEPSMATPSEVAPPLAPEPAARDVARPAEGAPSPWVSLVALGELRGGLAPSARPSLAVGIDVALARPKLF